MIIAVALLRRMPLRLPFLDYTAGSDWAEKIKIGQLVSVPFRNRIEFGVILNIEKKEAPANLKHLKEIIWEAPALSQTQLEFLKEISLLYHVPLGFLCKDNLLPLKKNKFKKIVAPPALEKNVATKPTKPFLFVFENEEQKRAYYAKEISVEQNLIIVPEISQLNTVYNLLSENERARALIVSSELTEKDFFDIWLKIWRQEAKIIIGTRRALFLPWNNLKNIFIEDEGNANHKSWDMAPRFHVKDASLLLGLCYGARVHLLTHTPSVESYYFAKNKVYQSNLNNIKNFSKKTQIIDLKDERRAGRYSFLSEALLDAMKEKRDTDMFFFLNRKGSYNFMGCRDCGFISRCEKCGRSLAYYETEKKLRCNFCHTEQPLTASCPTCHGVNMVMRGVGTQLAFNEIAKNLGASKKVLRLDADSVEKDIAPNGQNIVVGTQIAWDKINWSKLGLLGFLDIDTPLFIPEYKITENLWQLLRAAQYKINQDGQIIIQTSHPEHPVLSFLSAPEKFYESELKQRAALKYPPYCFLLRIFCGLNNEQAASATLAKIALQIKGLTKNEKEVNISGPLPFTPLYLNGRYWYALIIKLPLANYKQLTKQIGALLPDDVKTDPNPINLLTF